MELKFKGIIIDNFKGERSQFVTFSDMEQGGLVKISFPLEVEIKLGSILNLHADVKPTIGKYGQTLSFVQNKNS